MRKFGTAVVIVISLVGAMVGVPVGVAQADPPPITFRPRVEFPASGGSALALGNLNGDAFLDVVTSDSVLLGDGAGGFGQPTGFTAGSFALSVALGDVNGDTFLDLVTANYFDNDLSVLLGDGAGGFGAKTDIAIGDTPSSVALGDVNGDTSLDLVAANQGSDSVSVLLGDGAGGFGAKTDFATSGLPRSLALADLNGDAELDLAVASILGGGVSVLLGDGAGGFGAKTDFYSSIPYFVTVGDVNGDAFPDLATANPEYGSVSILLGDGTGGFGPNHDLATGEATGAVALGDLNGDTFPDVAATDYQRNTLSVLPGDGAGGFGAKTDFAAGPGAFSLALTDLNGDSLLDVVSVDSNGVSVLQNTTGLPATVPDPPTIGSATAGDAQATVSWTPPGYDGGAPVTGYVVTPYIGAAAQTPVAFGSTVTTQTVVGLTNGTTYTFTVAATNSVGAGPASDASNPVTPRAPTAPDAPTIGTATAGVAQATVSWTAPAFDGGAPVTGYRVTPYIGAIAQPPVAFGSTVTTQTVVGLTNGTTYTFTVAATNSVGTGPASDPTNPVTPAATAPDAPTIVKNAIPGNTEATVSWTRPASDGGSPITAYVVTPYIGFYPLTAQTFTSTATTQTVTGLTNGTTYRFRVQAINAIGTSGFSKVTNPVTPKAVIVVTPDTDLLDGQTVAVDGFGWQPGHQIAFCQSVVAGSPGPGNCADGLYTLVTADSTGHISGSLTLQRTMLVPNLGQVVDCAAPAQSCVVGAADGQDVAGTAVTVPLAFVTAPGAPTILRDAIAGNASATVSWTAPASDGGSPITGYVVTPYIGYYPLAPQTFSSVATTQVISALANGTTYRFRVQAFNAVGTGGYSKVTNPVTPTA